MFAIILGCLTGLCLGACSNNSTTKDDLLVVTNVGSYQGFAASSRVRAWLGIPYGAPTNGSKRFRPPQRADVLLDSRPFDATRFGLGCPQNKGLIYQGQLAFGGINSVGNFSEGDDCLNLNIWSPMSNTTDASLSAVMIWIYGGSGQFGGSAVPYYDGQAFVDAQTDVIVVSINYRTNIFGNVAGSYPGLSPTQTNLALFDQRMAVEWVYNNIRPFGGDPERITLFGESAGAGAIALWPYAYQWDPIVKGLILESGTEDIFSSQGGLNLTLAEEAWQTVAVSSGCGQSNFSRNAQFECMQNVPFQVIQQAVSNTSLANSFVSQIDNVTLFDNREYIRRRSEGGFAKIPMLIGTNKDEGTLFQVSLGISSELITKYGFACPAAAVAQSRTNHSVPAFLYEYVGTYPNLDPYAALGVYHGSEIPMVFGTYNISVVAPPTQQQIRTSKQIQDAWATFARDPRGGLIEYGWRSYTEDSASVNVLGTNVSSVVTFEMSNNYTKDCQLLFPEVV